MQEILKQPQYSPMTLEHQVMVIFAGTNGYSDGVLLEQMKRWEAELLRYMDTSHPDIGSAIAENKRITPEIETPLREALQSFTDSWQ